MKVFDYILLNEKRSIGESNQSCWCYLRFQISFEESQEMMHSDPIRFKNLVQERYGK